MSPNEISSKVENNLMSVNNVGLTVNIILFCYKLIDKILAFILLPTLYFGTIAIG